jgi:hypothetical protein
MTLLNKIAIDTVNWCSSDETDGKKMWNVFYHYWQDVIGLSYTPKPVNNLLKRYHGYKVGSIAWGKCELGFALTCEGEQAGEIAKIVSRETFSQAFHATRVDVQLTCETVDDFVPIAKLKEGVFTDYQFRGRIIEDENDLGTLYLGKRTAPRMWRIYHKEINGSSRWLRIELESKKHLAAKLWQMGLSDENIRSYLATEFFKLHISESVKDNLVNHTALMRGATSLKIQSVERGRSNTLAWLTDTVTPSIIRLLNEPDERGEMMDLIDGWVRLARETGNGELSLIGDY